MEKEAKIWQVLDKDGKVIKLVEAQSSAQVKKYLLRDVFVTTPSPITVAKLMEMGMKVEKA